MANSLRTSVDVSLTPRQAFDTLVDELTLALNDRGMKFTPSSAGKMLEGDVEVGISKNGYPATESLFSGIPRLGKLARLADC